MSAPPTPKRLWRSISKAQAAGKAPAVDMLDMTVGDVFEGWKTREYRDIVGKDYSAYLDIPSVGAKHLHDALNDFQAAQLAKLAADGVLYADTALMLCYTGF